MVLAFHFFPTPSLSLAVCLYFKKISWSEGEQLVFNSISVVFNSTLKTDL